MERLGSLLASLRQRKNLTLRDVERETGVSNAYVSQIETDKIKAPSPIVLHKLAALYGVQYRDLDEGSRISGTDEWKVRR